MKRTKIICSIGPASNNYDTMKDMIINGMDCALIDVTLSNQEERKLAIDVVNLLNEDMGTNVAVLFDTEGPDFRTGALQDKVVNLVAGETIKVVRDEVLGTKDQITVNYKEIVDKCDIGDSMIIEGGLMELEVFEKTPDCLNCKIIIGGALKNRMALRVPCVDLGIDFINDQYRADIKYACENDCDFLTLSFVSSAQDVYDARELVKEYGNEKIQLISKIESVKGVENIDEIIAASDGILFSRLCLGLEVPLRDVPILQKTIVDKCRKSGKICIISTEMLGSMFNNVRPTRAEVCDVANAIIEGPDAVMLSGETQVGKYPVESVKMMAQICEDTESYALSLRDFEYDHPENDSEAILRSVFDYSKTMEIRTIFAATMTGYTAKQISSLRPNSIVIAGCPNRRVCRSIALNWGVYSAVIGECDYGEEVVSLAKKTAKEMLYLQRGDRMIFVGGFPKGTPTNTMTISQID